jgi:prevent-host-death family protein
MAQKKNKYSIYETKTHLSKLLKRVVKGEELLISHRDKVIARLVSANTAYGKRKPGSAKGMFIMMDDFNEPLPEDFLKHF